MENEIMKFEEVMEFLNVGKNTLYALLNRGEIRAFRILVAVWWAVFWMVRFF